MASENETVAEAIEITKAIFLKDIGDVNERCQWCRRKLTEQLDRIETAHRREVDKYKNKWHEAVTLAFDIDKLASIEKQTESLLKKNEIIAGLRREVAELRECLKEAVDFHCGKCINKGGPCNKDCLFDKWRKALEGAEDEKDNS